MPSSYPPASADPASDDWRSAGFGIYLHWPFCQAKCPYCDFNSHVATRIDMDRWQAAYLREIDRAAALVPGRVVNSIFLGGGTPSLMAPGLVDAILSRLRAHWPMANDVEITMEANPGSSDAERFRGYADAGVNRLSMGVQALDDGDLRRLGRIHSVDEALAAFDLARGIFDRVSFDLIYARQDQTLAAWEAELKRALSLAVDHVSLYQLTIEDGTAFGDRFRRGGLKGLPDDDLSADMYDLTQEIAAEHGFWAYEVSNLARSGAESVHNGIYWRQGDYLGIGPGAHGRLTLDGTRHATESPRAPGLWLDRVESGSEATHLDPLDVGEAADEFLIMGLRLSEGIDPERYRRLRGAPLEPERIARLNELGMIELANGRLAATPRGRLVLNAVIRDLAGG